MSMFADTTYAKTMTVAKKLLNVYGLRAEVIADNIANVSTPNFKRSDVTFEYQLGITKTSRLRKKSHLLFPETKPT